MSIWSRFLDWVLGAEFMTIDDFRASCDSLKAAIGSRIDKLPDMIDADDNDRISVREAIGLVKTLLGGVVSDIRRFF